MIEKKTSSIHLLILLVSFVWPLGAFIEAMGQDFAMETPYESSPSLLSEVASWRESVERLLSPKNKLGRGSPGLSHLFSTQEDLQYLIESYFRMQNESGLDVQEIYNKILLSLADDPKTKEKFSEYLSHKLHETQGLDEFSRVLRSLKIRPDSLEIKAFSQVLITLQSSLIKNLDHFIKLGGDADKLREIMIDLHLPHYHLYSNKKKVMDSLGALLGQAAGVLPLDEYLKLVTWFISSSIKAQGSRRPYIDLRPAYYVDNFIQKIIKLGKMDLIHSLPIDREIKNDLLIRRKLHLFRQTQDPLQYIQVYRESPPIVNGSYKTQQRDIILQTLAHFFELGPDLDQIKDILTYLSEDLLGQSLDARNIQLILQGIYKKSSPREFMEFVELVYQDREKFRAIFPLDSVHEALDLLLMSLDASQFQKWINVIPEKGLEFILRQNINLDQERTAMIQRRYWDEKQKKGRTLLAQYFIELQNRASQSDKVQVNGDSVGTSCADGLVAQSELRQKISGLKEILCPICYEDVPSQDCVDLKCGDSYCLNCMEKYVAEQMGLNAWPIKCMNRNCPNKQVLSLTDLGQLVPSPDVLQLFYYRLAKTHLLQNHGSPCTQGECLMILDLERDKNKKFIKCPACEADFCRECKSSHSESLNCEDHQKERAFAKGMVSPTTLETRPCPHCRTLIYKSEACDHMRCKTCNKLFDWVTGKSYRSAVTYGGFASGQRPPDISALPRTYRVEGDINPLTGETYKEYREGIIEDLPATWEVWKPLLRELIQAPASRIE